MSFENIKALNEGFEKGLDQGYTTGYHLARLKYDPEYAANFTDYERYFASTCTGAS